MTTKNEHSMTTTTTHLLRPTDLADIVTGLVDRPQQWMERVRLNPSRRWYERLEVGDGYEVWLLSWLPGQGTGLHDHGASSGAFVVATGSLEERRPHAPPLRVKARGIRTFGPHYIHDVRNVSAAPAVSIHVYSPALTDIVRYALNDGELRPVPEGSLASDATGSDRTAPTRRYGIDSTLDAIRRRLHRFSATEAHGAAGGAGAVLVDIRPFAQRAQQGTVPGALVIERNVLEWRFDPASTARLPFVSGYDIQPVILCSEGYASSLAAASLQEIGLWRATDVIGGFSAWRDAGLPIGHVSDMGTPSP